MYRNFSGYNRRHVPPKGTLVLDFLRYITGLAIFLLTSLALLLTGHLLILMQTKRKNAPLPVRQK